MFFCGRGWSGFGFGDEGEPFAGGGDPDFFVAGAVELGPVWFVAVAEAAYADRHCSGYSSRREVVQLGIAMAFAIDQ